MVRVQHRSCVLPLDCVSDSFRVRHQLPQHAPAAMHFCHTVIIVCMHLTVRIRAWCYLQA